MKKINKQANRIVEKDVLLVKRIGYVFFTIMSILIIAPFVVLLSASFSSEDAISLYGYGLFPKEFSIDAWKYLWQARSVIGQAYMTTIILTVVGVVLSLLVTSLGAYALIQKIPGRGLVMGMLVLTLLFNGGIVSSYYVWAGMLKIKNTFAALLFPGLLTNAFTIILVMSYYKTSIPSELLEAARIDGAGELRIYFQIVLPLSLPILATVGLMSALAYWNDWTNGLYYVSPGTEYSHLHTIQYLLNQMNQEIEFMTSNPDFAAQFDMAVPQASVRMAIALVGVLPLIIAFPFFQKYFAKGLTMGGIKG